MILCYAGRSRPSAYKIAEQNGNIQLNRGNIGDVNWGRSSAHTRLNPDISNVTNKRIMRTLFAEHGVPMPKLYEDYSAIDRMVGIIAGRRERFEAIATIVGRPDHHTRGRGFWKCRTMEDVQRALRGTRRKRAATHFMEYINAEREYRVHIFQGKSIRISEKSFFTDDNGRKEYTTAKPSHDVSNVRKAAKQAVAAVGLDFGAVDILASGENNEQVWVLEVNAAPGLGGSMPLLYANVFQDWYDSQE